MIGAARNYFGEAWEAWNGFWFTPTSPSTLSAIRVLAGAMLLYTHIVWTYDLDAFFAPDGWLPQQVMEEARLATNDPDGPTRPEVASQRFMPSHFNYIHSHKLRLAAHLGALLVFFLLTIGLFSRTMALLGYILAVSYANRITPGAYFGLDKINCMLVMYLMLGPCGARYSIDRLWRLRRGAPSEVPPSTWANVAIRLIQLHMCVIYFFSALGKLQGPTWWLGEAMWYSVANKEYQTMDLTWLINHPWLVNFMTHLAVYWELTYPALIWPRLTRPWMLAMAVILHGGIIVALGMPTFGLVMLIGNLAFVSPQTVRKIFDPLARRIALATLGTARQSPKPVAAT
ncbi:MAG: HTTM domain-containing protein [Pirellulales bacterium]